MWNPGQGAPRELNVYPGGGSLLRDFTTLAPWDVLRDHCRRWDSGTSDVDGCARLFNPRALGTLFASDCLLSDKVPFILVLGEVHARGWEIAEDNCQQVAFTDASIGKDSRPTYRDRDHDHFQCLLCLQDLFNRGLSRFVHAEPHACYRLLMRSDHPEEVLLKQKKHMLRGLPRVLTLLQRIGRLSMMVQLVQMVVCPLATMQVTMWRVIMSNRRREPRQRRR